MLINRYYRLNYNIPAREVRLISEEGRQIGIVSKEEALKKANELNVDLVEISPNANPPVCKLIDFKKFKYLISKKERQDRKKTREGEIKEIRFRPFTDEHDLEVRKKTALKFLKKGQRIKLAVKFAGREIAKKEFGYNLLNQLIESLKENCKVDTLPHFEGRTLVTIISPVK